jgi:hypothetical protein
MKRNTPKPAVSCSGKYQHHGKSSTPAHQSRPLYVAWAELIGEK